jgi:hypothetical protein
MPEYTCMDCDATTNLMLAYDDPEFGVVAGYVCVDADACVTRQEDN